MTQNTIWKVNIKKVSQAAKSELHGFSSRVGQVSKKTTKAAKLERDGCVWEGRVR